MTSKVTNISYFVAKCYTMDGLKTSFQNNVWACNERNLPPQPKDILTEALEKGPVYLIFSVNNCHGWHGYAEMLNMPGEASVEITNQVDRNQVWHRFNVKWHKIFLKEHGEKCLPFSVTNDMYVDAEHTLPINKARNYQQIFEETGHAMKKLIEEYYEDLTVIKKQKEEEKVRKLGDPFFKPISLITDINEIWAELYKTVSKLGKIHLACAFGSQRYNLHTPESDMDMFVVYESPADKILGFATPQQTIKNRETESCDYTIHEVHHYCELLLNGDPRCVETLFLHPSAVYYTSPEWKKLIEHRQKFLNRNVLDKYTKDALGAKGIKQMEKYIKSGEAQQLPMTKKVAKLFYIIIRLLQNACNVVHEQELVVYRPDNSPERKLLMNVRQGNCSFDNLQEHVNSLVQEINEKKDSLLMDCESHKSVLEDWLLQVRYESLHLTMQAKQQIKSN